ncbi:MAG: metal-dependent hydrolase, partial [Saprospiraceae bacterium]
MTAPNHIVGGITITGIAGGFLGINILESHWYLVTIFVAAQLPDIDHTKSFIGLTFYPIAKYLNRSYGHRTITHSLAALVTLSLLAGMASVYFTDSKIYGTIFFLAYLSHLILDMTTVQGVPLFYPFLKNPCVVPGDPKMRFESGNIRTESMAFFFFIAMGVFMQPLMESGFWTVYNKSWGTPAHLYSEFRKSDDLLEVEYFGKKGSDRVEGSGYVIEAAKEKAILVQNGKFFILDAKDFVIEKVIPTHTGRKYFYQNLSFVNIDIDSLNLLCLDQLITKMEVHANKEFVAWADDFEQPAAKKFKGELHSNLFFQQKETKETELATYRHVTNPRIKLLRDKLARLQNQQAKAQVKGTQHQKKLDQLRQQSKQETDYLKIEQLLTEIKALEKVPKPKDYSDQ